MRPRYHIIDRLGEAEGEVTCDSGLPGLDSPRSRRQGALLAEAGLRAASYLKSWVDMEMLTGCRLED